MFSEVIATRFSDTDGLGHINNTMVPVWFEGARDPVFKWFMPDLDLTKWNLILAKIDVEFHAQMYYGEKMEIRTYIGRIGVRHLMSIKNFGRRAINVLQVPLLWFILIIKLINHSKFPKK